MREILPTAAQFDNGSIVAQLWLSELYVVTCDQTDAVEAFIEHCRQFPDLIRGIQNGAPLVVAAEGTSAPIAEFCLFRGIEPFIAATAHDVAWQVFDIRLIGVVASVINLGMQKQPADPLEVARLIARMERERLLASARFVGDEKLLYSMRDLRELTGYDDNEAITRRLRACGIRTASQGGRNWQCTFPEAIRVLEMVAMDGNLAAQEKARESLARMAPKPD